MDIEIALSNSTNLENTYAAFVIHGRAMQWKEYMSRYSWLAKATRSDEGIALFVQEIEQSIPLLHRQRGTIVQ